MYFEGCLGFNVIQQNGLMSRVFVGSFLLLRITSRPAAFIRLDLWVLIWEWIIGYLPPLPSHPCSMVCAARVCVCVCSWGHGRIQGRPPLSEHATPIKMNSSPPLNKHLFWFSLITKWFNILRVFLSCFFFPLRSCRAAAVLHRPSDEARQLERAEAWHVNSR